MSPLCEYVWIHHRKFDEAGLSWCVPDALGCFDVIIRFGEKDIRYVALRVAVVQWNRLDCTCTMMRCPVRNVWLAFGRSKRYNSG